MKKILSAVLVLTLLLLTACGGNSSNAAGENADNGSAQTPAVIDSIYTDLTGIPAEKAVVTVDGNEVPAALYCYYIVSTADTLLYQLQYYAVYYGMYTNAFNADGSVNWDYELAEGMTLTAYLEQQTSSTAGYYAMLENMAAEAGITLTDEDRAAIAEQMTKTAEEYRTQMLADSEDMTAEEVMEKYLETIGIDRALHERLSAIPYYYNYLVDQVMTPGSPYYLEDADCNEYGYFADHILISTVDTETREPLSDEEILAKTSLVREILTRLEESTDPIAMFDRLADEYSEDPGRQTNPEGYIFTPGTMVAEFESATEALEFGEISGIVESDYGYHIILRKDLVDGLALYPDQKAMFAEEHLGSLINLEMFDAEIVYDEALTGFDYVKFYTEYSAKIRELSGQVDLQNATK